MHSGGKREKADDGSPEITAAREAEEESHWQLPSTRILPWLQGARAVHWSVGSYILYMVELQCGLYWDLPSRFAAQVECEYFR